MNLENRSSYEKSVIQKAIDKGLPIEKYFRTKFSIWTIKYLITLLSEGYNLEDFPFDEYMHKFKFFYIVFIEGKNGKVGLSQI